MGLFKTKRKNGKKKIEEPNLPEPENNMPDLPDFGLPNQERPSKPTPETHPQLFDEFGNRK